MVHLAMLLLRMAIEARSFGRYWDSHLFGGPFHQNPKERLDCGPASIARQIDRAVFFYRLQLVSVLCFSRHHHAYRFLRKCFVQK